MIIEVKRFMDSGNETLGLLFINGIHRAYTLEDEKRTQKVYGETRIPEGVYKLALRTEGAHHDRYSKKFPEIHKGMLHVEHVVGFKFILIHIGNTDDDTAGCLLIGSNIGSDNRSITKSTDCYKAIYPEIAKTISSGEPVTIKYTQIYGRA